MRLHFAQAGLERTAINTIYSHVLNPMIASRSYMSIEPIELWLDTRALRRGLVYPVAPDSDPTALLIQDSGMVPVSTQIAIVNPETCHLCHVGEYGEIWVQSEASAKAFYLSKQKFDLERFNGRIAGGDPTITYVRTGDLGFLHNVTRPIGAGGQPVEMQVLFNLGSVGETFEVNGLNHFPMDIENSVERCHRNISPGGSAVFQAGGLVVVLVEVFRKAYLASIVPVIVNTILNEHQLVVDMIAFVSNGDFPRSRLGEKQRGKILASWVTRKLRTIAQFGIRDPDSAENHIMEVPAPRTRTNNASMVSRSNNSRLDMARSSIVSESPIHMAPARDAGYGSRESAFMSADQMSIPSNRPQAPSEPVYGGQDVSRHEATNAPIVALNDRPYILSERPRDAPSQRHDDYTHNEAADLHDDNKFYDPNADPYYPYGDLTPQASTSDINIPAQPRFTRLSITNPSELATYPEEPTPTTVSASHPASNNLTNSYFPHPSAGPSATPASTTPSTWTGDSPFRDAGNPYTEYYNANQNPTAQTAAPPHSNLDMENTPHPQPTLTSPPPPIPESFSPPPLPTPPAGRGRATLPSQQQKARLSSYGAIAGAPTGLRVINHSSTPSPPPPPLTGPPNDETGGHHRPAAGWDEANDKELPLPQEALLYVSRPSPRQEEDHDARDGKLLGEGRRPESRRSEAGSVRGRYDGSGYDGW